jgi:uncharacterized membrane protein
MMVEQTVTAHSGPLPAPEIIAGYEKVLPGTADRIVKMAEKEQDHRHKVINRTQTHVAILTFLGQLFAFTIGVIGILAGVYLVQKDKSIAGFSVFFTSLAGLVGVFIFGRKKTPNQPQ